jgi:DNA-binding PadR family transcriptional regulator
MAESTRYAVLGLIVRESTYGYAVAEELRRWPVDEGRAPTERAIYRALDWLTSEGFIEPHEPTVVDIERLATNRAGRSAAENAARTALIRRIYAATPDGERRFDEWLRSPITSEEELWWRLGASRPCDLPALIAAFRQAEDTWLGRLQAQPSPAVDSILTRSSWAATRAALLGTFRAEQLGGQLQLVRQLLEILEALDAEGSPAVGER